MQACLFFSFPYHLLGSSSHCPACSHLTIPMVPTEVPYPEFGIEVTYRDFCGLLNDDSVKGKLSLWFSYTIKEVDGVDRLVSSGGDVIDTLWLHQRIQRDREKASEIYNLAMSIWHS